MSVSQAGSNPKDICVCGLLFDGRGDVVGAKRIADLIADLYKENVTFTICEPNLSFQERLVYALSGREIKPLTKEESKTWGVEEFSEKLIAGKKMFVVFPTYQDSLLPDWIQSAKVPVVKLREPGSGPPLPDLVRGEAFNLGVGKGEWGIVFLDDLFRDALLHVDDTSLERLKCLEQVPDELTKLILGSSYSSESVAAFDQSSRLHTGYGSHAEFMGAFVNAVAAIPDQKNVTVCLMTEMPENFDSLLDIRLLFGLGFKNFQIFSGEQLKYNKTFKQGAKGDRTLKIIFYPLPNFDHTVALRKSANRATLGTGDQSFNENLALCMHSAYDVRAHKNDSAIDYIEIAKQIDPKLVPLLQLCFFAADQPSEVVDFRILRPAMTRFFTELAKPDLGKKWLAFIERIAKEHNLRNRLPDLLKKALAKDQASSQENKMTSLSDLH